MSAKKMSALRYTEKEWEKIKPALRSLSVSTSDAAYQVMVKGRSVIDVAEEFGCNRQTVYAAVDRVRKRLKNHGVTGNVPLLIWAPESDVQKITDAVNEAGGIVEGE